MKKLLVLVLLSPLAFAEKNEMMPLPQWYELNKDKIQAYEPNASLYFSYRCIGLYTTFFAHAVSLGEAATSETVAEIQELQDKHIFNAIVFYDQLTPKNYRDFDNNMLISVEPMAKNYQLEMNRSYTNTGSHFSSFITEDNQICGRYLNHLSGESK